MIHLTLDDALHIARRTIGDDVLVRDAGLLAGAVARPATTVGGEDAYGTIAEKAAALAHSVVRDHALVDGNKRLGLMVTIVFLRMNGHRLTMTNDQAYDFVMAIAERAVDDVPSIAARLAPHLERV